MSNTASVKDRPADALAERPVSLSLALFQSIGDPVMQCAHGASLFATCKAC